MSSKSPHENEKALSPSYKKIFLIENERKGALLSFSIKNIFYGKMDLSFFIFV